MNKFPNDFLWGASTSAYQIEGCINEGGKVSSTMDIYGDKPNYPKGITGFKEASEHYKYWKTDVEMMAKMKLKSYRFSISWPRIIKNENGDVNQEGIKFYNDLIDELLKHKIEPVVTMFHFDIPLFVMEDGGVHGKNFVKHFELYAEILLKHFGSKINYWLTINELNILVMMADGFELLEKKDFSNQLKVLHNLNLAQAKAIIKCKEMCPKAKIGPAPNISTVYANTCKPEDYTAKLNIDLIRNWVYLDAVCKGGYSNVFMSTVKKMGINFEVSKEDLEILAKGKPDFIAFNYYSTSTAQMPTKEMIKNNKEKLDQQKGLVLPGFGMATKNPHLPKTQFGWEIDPVGFRNTLREVYDRYGLPMMITENGIGARDVLTEDGKIHDDYRIEYYQKHIEQMGLAIEDGVEMIGYMPWSAIDLVSTHEGISKRYGFIYVNRDEFDLKDMRRIEKDSYYWYKNLIETNGENI
ncbi:Beta-glucosidase; 6-phospho-beta-glucosidase [Mesoplasma florum W37]|uniref:Beta-glucosidase n=1 Tax=Mesoplasma florum TaxID=2151 RepID=A0AAD0HSK9_MESFO|nr:glycoside hydrolase family 1 protein [Mesoplasma florum]AGY41076.1 Beta-glucosidase; 6-phospho-beta-glucosidase [Mesoplasma florum W37]AVN59310.1 glycoside hydrolase family 1 protein [Mesoplasma florum]AVN65414.1 Beta-glucosidase [Mesoplasma florum]